MKHNSNNKSSVRRVGVILVPIAFLGVCLCSGFFLTKALVPLDEHQLGRHHVAWLIVSTVIHSAIVGLMALEALEHIRGKRE